MKKRLISFLVLISAFLFIGNVKAIEMDKDDIETGSYVIGTHLFERKQTAHYDGTLTVQHIMLAAQSIGSNDINDMIIYLKNSRGKWVNGLTNESITVPENFEIEYKNVEKISEFASYGDVNSDGEIDIFDAVAVLQYIDGQIEFSEEQKKSADVNVDGYIDLIDRHLILGFNANYFPNTLPSKPITDYVLYGDVLDSGDPYADKEGGMPIYVMQQYVSGNTSSLEGQALKNADINGDGKVDHIDSAIIFWYVNDRLDITLPSFTPITDYTLYGDVTNDGIINNKDSIMLSDFINNKDTLTKQGFKNADINADGNVDNTDLEILTRALEIGSFDGDIPAIKPIHKYTITFDSNGGSAVPNGSAITYDKVSEPDKPTKEGYIFSGWYLNDEFYNFNSSITSDITLVANWEPYKYNVAYINTCGNSHRFENNSTLNFVGSGIMGQQTMLEYDKTYGIPENNYKCSATVSFVTGTSTFIEDKTVEAHFKGWSTDEVDGEVTHPYNGIITNLSNTNQTAYLYTVWGSQYDESTIVLPEPGIKEGYIFKGWYSDSEFNNSVGGAGGNYYATSGTTLYAKWEPIIYEINYDKNDSSATGIIQPHFCTYDQDCELKIDGFEKLGYKVKGWATTADGEVEYSSDTTLTVKNLTTTYGKRITLYAVWELVIGDANADGLINPADNTAIRKHLAGMETLSGDRLLAADVNQDGVVDYVDVQVMRMYLNKDIKELPYKTGTKYTITYNLDDGIVTYNPAEYISNHHDITIENPTREGYLFLGWTGSNGLKAQTDLVIPEETTGNLTYTANWISVDDIPEAPTIKLDADTWLNNGVYEGVFDLCGTTGTSIPVGAELYEKNGNNYTLVDSVTNGCELLFNLKPGEAKVYTARVYINYDEENKVYSNYSNEVLIKNENVITYDLDGGLNSVNNKFGYSPTYPYQRELEAPTKAGYTFLGWTGSNGDTPELEVSIPLDVTGHLHYVANWELTDESAIDNTIPLVPTIEIDPLYNLWTTSGQWQGEFDFCKTGAYDYKNVPAGAELYEKTSSGYTLVDSIIDDCYLYFELNPGDTKVYAARVYTLDDDNNKVYSNYSNEVLLKNENIITYDLDGGVNSSNNKFGYYYPHSPNPIELEVPTKEGYTFLGWTGSNGDIPQKEVKIFVGTTGHLHYIANWEKTE